MESLDERVAATEARLRRWCSNNNVRVLPDDTVSEKDAGRLCGFRNGNGLVQRHREGLSVPRSRTTGARRFYRVIDIAAWLEVGFD